MSNSFKREVSFTPAYDKRNADPKKNYGIHGVDLRMYLIGEKGAVQFVVFTGWHLAHVEAEFDAKGTRDRFLDRPMPADLGYHSKVPRYEGQPSMGECSVIGCECYYDGSGLNAERVFDIMVNKGSDGVWAELERYYADVFGEAE